MVKLGCAAKQMPLGCKNAKLFLTEPQVQGSKFKGYTLLIFLTCFNPEP